LTLRRPKDGKMERFRDFNASATERERCSSFRLGRVCFSLKRKRLSLYCFRGSSSIGLLRDPIAFCVWRKTFSLIASCTRVLQRRTRGITRKRLASILREPSELSNPRNQRSSAPPSRRVSRDIKAPPTNASIIGATTNRVAVAWPRKMLK